MKLRYFISLFISLLFLYSCGDSSSTSYSSEPSEDAQIYSFKMEATHKKEGDSISRAADSLRFLVLNKTNFAINQVSSFVYNPDSLPQGLNLDKVKLTLTTNTTYGVSKIEISTPDSTYDWNSTDSVDFSKMPIKIIIHAPKGNAKEYDINVNIHNVDPDKFVWEHKGSIAQSEGQQKVLVKENDFYAYAVVAGVVKLFKSDKSTLSWVEYTTSVLPNTVILNSITFFNGKFMAISSDGNSFSSDNGIDWQQQNNGENVLAIYGVVPSKDEADDFLLLLIESGGKYILGTTKDLVSVEKPSVVGLPSEDVIPVFDFASATNYDRNSGSKFLIITGGITKGGVESNSTFIVEKTSTGLTLSRSTKNGLFKGAGLSLFFYTQNHLYVIANNQLYFSTSWGEKWQKSTLKHLIDTDVPERTEQSVVVENGNIWIFGGKEPDTESTTGVYLNDIWKGRQNGFK